MNGSNSSRLNVSPVVYHLDGREYLSKEQKQTLGFGRPDDYCGHVVNGNILDEGGGTGCIEGLFVEEEEEEEEGKAGF